VAARDNCQHNIWKIFWECKKM